MVEAGTIQALSKVMEVGPVGSVLPLVAAALRCLTQVASPTEAPPKDKDKEKDGIGGAPSGDADDGAGARYKKRRHRHSWSFCKPMFRELVGMYIYTWSE